MKKTSVYFKFMVENLYDTMMFRKGPKSFSIFLWIGLPFTISMVLGWYIADIMMEDEEK